MKRQPKIKLEVPTYKRTLSRLEKWIDKGDKVAVYKNEDLSSPEVGHKVFLRVGKGATLKKAPKRMPDNPIIPRAWRYRLQTVVGSKKRLKKVI